MSHTQGKGRRFSLVGGSRDGEYIPDQLCVNYATNPPAIRPVVQMVKKMPLPVVTFDQQSPNDLMKEAKYEIEYYEFKRHGVGPWEFHYVYRG